MDLNPGSTVGDYQILSLLGAGGMGKVYKVRNTISDRVEAMKVLLPELCADPDLTGRFQREIKVSASLEHPNIAALHTAQRLDGQMVMLMEFVEGATLDTLMRQAPVNLANGVGFVMQVLSALSYAHGRGVVHRDIKPGNIMLTPEGAIKLMDFGIARLTKDSKKLTRTGQLVGSLFYLAPEVIEGSEPDPRADLYALGVTLYEIATGKRPFDGASEFSIMQAHVKGAPVAPVELDHSLPPALNDVILLAIAKDPAKRFQSADAFRNALGGIAKSLGVEEDSRTRAAMPLPKLAPMGGPTPAKSSHRALYMVAGSLLTVLILVLAATQAPRFLKARASSSPNPPVVTSTAKPDEPRPVESKPDAKADTPSPQSSAPAPVAKPPVSTSAKPAPERPRTDARETPARLPSSEPNGVQQPPPPQPVQPTPQPQVEQRAPAHAAAPDEQLLGELRERMTQLAARANPVRTSIQSLQREQAKSGLNLRGDVQGMLQRMESYMDGAESQLSRNNAAGAQKSLDSAERELERLEKFLGRE